MAGPPPFKLDGLDHVVLLVDDTQRARRFYCDVLGCSVDQELPQYGMLQLRAGKSLIDVVDVSTKEGASARPPIEGGRNMDHVCLATRGFSPEEMHSHLASHGVEIVEEGIRYGATGDGYSVYLNDPFGNQIELKSPITD
jgi:catechol 2,3-dioxygenase-like lactoylglutathione lyase family enzyme